MAILAGGNPAGSGGTAGIGQSLNYIGEHVYAYSGVQGATSSGTTFLKFVTGSQYIVGVLQCNYAANDAEDMTYEVKFDGQVVQQWFHPGATGVSNASAEPQNAMDLIIPGYTKVEIIITSASSTRNQSASIVGRVYD